MNNRTPSSKNRLLSTNLATKSGSSSAHVHEVIIISQPNLPFKSYTYYRNDISSSNVNTMDLERIKRPLLLQILVQNQFFTLAAAEFYGVELRNGVRVLLASIINDLNKQMIDLIFSNNKKAEF